MTGVPYVETGAAIVHGRAATGVAWLLRRAIERGDLNAIPEAVRAETLAAIQAVDLASRAWARRTSVSTSEFGSSAARQASTPSSSSHEITTAEAAELLGVGERRARDLAASGLGRRAGGRWLLDRAAVEAEVERRTVA